MRYRRAVFRCFFLSGLTAVIPAALAADALDCPDVADPPAAICLPATHGLTYADTHDDARLAVTAVDAAAVQFDHLLGRSLPPRLLVLSSTFGGDDAQRFALAHGLGLSQSWLSPADTRAQVDIVMRRAMPDADAAKIDAALAQIEAQHVDNLRHELGPVQYRAAFWPHAAPSIAEYGTPAPDWLDEASAVLMEGSPGRTSRELHFMKAWRQSSPAIRPLAEFLTMAHPVTARKRALMQTQSGTQTASGVQVMTMRGPDATAGGMIYSQSLVFADVLIDASPDPQVLGTISAAAASGIEFTDWLADTAPSTVCRAMCLVCRLHGMPSAEHAPRPHPIQPGKMGDPPSGSPACP